MRDPFLNAICFAAGVLLLCTFIGMAVIVPSLFF